jgi:hypothetical protein
VKHLNNFMLKLKNSGYSVEYRKNILKSALNAFDQMCKDDQSGIKPLYRDREWNKEERNHQKQSRKVNWYKGSEENIEYKSVLFVPVTKGGMLAKEMKNREEEINKYSKERIKIVEGGAIQMKNILVNKNPFPTQTCEIKKCIICESKEPGKIPCNSNNVGYQLICNTCSDRGKQKVYEGETARSARIRGVEHLRGFKGGKSDSVLHKHKQTDHENEDMEFSMKITKRFRDPLSRQANEAVRISNRPKGELLNSKTEFNHPPIARVIVERGKKYPNQKN